MLHGNECVAIRIAQPGVFIAIVKLCRMYVEDRAAVAPSCLGPKGKQRCGAEKADRNLPRNFLVVVSEKPIFVLPERFHRRRMKEPATVWPNDSCLQGMVLASRPRPDVLCTPIQRWRQRRRRRRLDVRSQIWKWLASPDQCLHVAWPSAFRSVTVILVMKLKSLSASFGGTNLIDPVKRCFPD